MAKLELHKFNHRNVGANNSSKVKVRAKTLALYEIELRNTMNAVRREYDKVRKEINGKH